MKKRIGYLFAFISGAIVYQLALILFFGNVSYKPEEKGVGVSDAYVKERLKDACDFLGSNGCDCHPVIHTSRSCKSVLNDFLRKH